MCSLAALLNLEFLFWFDFGFSCSLFLDRTVEIDGVGTVSVELTILAFLS